MLQIEYNKLLITQKVLMKVCFYVKKTKHIERYLYWFYGKIVKNLTSQMFVCVWHLLMNLNQ
jgi:hypothetical protein